MHFLRHILKNASVIKEEIEGLTEFPVLKSYHFE